MKYLIALISLVVLTPVQVNAACNTVSSVLLVIGGPPVHVTPIDTANNCVALDPSTITWAPLGTPAIAQGDQDSTGFNLTGLAIGNVNAVLTSSVHGSQPGVLAITVVNPSIQVGVTSP